MILQRTRTIVVDAGFEPGTSASEVWCATNEPPHLRMANYITFKEKITYDENDKIEFEFFSENCLSL